LGNALASGSGYANIMGFEESPHNHFPPGYPAFISVLIKIGAKSVHSIKVANGVLLYGSLVLLFFIFSFMSRNRLLAFVATCFAASHPALLRFATIMMSEMQFVFLSSVLLFIVLYYPPEKFFVARKKYRRDILLLCILAGCIGSIYFTRNVGLTVVLAVILYYGIFAAQKFVVFLKNLITIKEPLSLRQSKTVLLKYAMILAITIVSVLIPRAAWDARKGGVAMAETGTGIGTYLGMFFAKTNNESMTTIADWKERLANNIPNYVGKYLPTSIFQYQTKIDSFPVKSNTLPTAGEWVAGIIVLLIMIFALMKLRSGLLLFLYMGIMFAMFMLMQEQYGGHRYMTPIMQYLVFLFIYGIFALPNALLLTFTKLKATPRYTNVLAAVVCVIFTVCCQPAYAANIKQAEAQSKVKVYNTTNSSPQFVEFLDAIRWCKNNLPATVRVASRKPELFYIFSGGRKSGGFPHYATPEEVVENFVKNKIDFVIIDHWFRHGYVTIVPAAQKYPDLFNVVHQIGDKKADEQLTYIIQFNHQAKIDFAKNVDNQ
jgi:hypothetical protein